MMKGYGQFCAIARTHEVLGGRWTLLVVRELLCGARHFNDIRRGVPRISRTMLSERLQALTEVGVTERRVGPRGPEYDLTAAGRQLGELVSAMAVWGQQWLPRKPELEDVDLEPLLMDMQRRVRLSALPIHPVVVRFEVDGAKPRFMLLKASEISVCSQNPGFPEVVQVKSRLAPLVGWWRGDISLLEAQRIGLRLEGQKADVRAFPGWFERYVFAHISPAPGAVLNGPDSVPHRHRPRTYG
jgi:DNA-binding HxlR family transcriptional regulator